MIYAASEYRMRLGFLFLLATATAFSADAAPQRWAKAMPTADFSVDQPMGWAKTVGPLDRLDLVNFACRPTVAGLCDGQAEISVRSEPGAPKAARTQACWNLAETVSETQVGPGRRTQTSQLSCSIGPRRFVIVERHWKGDKHAANYERISMRMAKSLRYPAKAPAKPLFPDVHLPKLPT